MRRVPWTRQPQGAVELASNWVACGLRAVFLPIAGALPGRTVAYTTVTRGVGGLSQATMPGVGSIGTNWRGVTFFVVANLNSTTPDAVAIGRVRYNNANNFGAALRFNTSRIEYNKGTGTSVWGFYTTATGRVLTGRNSYAAIDIPGSIPKVYRNGVDAGFEGYTNETITPTAFDGAMDVGQSTASGQTAITGAIDGLIEIGAWFDAPITVAQLRALSDNPWQLLQPRRIWVPVSVASTGAPTLSAATFVPGSITASGFQPRVTITF